VRESPQADFFVLRAPLLALETLTRWAEGTEALAADADGDVDDEQLEQVLRADRELLRGRLAELAADEQIADGLELASPDLVDALASWRVDHNSKRARSAERALVRYVTRLGSRSDLFGLAGAYIVGRFSEQTRLELGPRAKLEVRARVDSGLLREVVRRAVSEAVGDPALVVKHNPGLYRVGGRLRVAARKHGSIAHRLVEIRPTPAIELALEIAAGGAPVATILAALEERGTPADHAPEVVRRLIASSVLVPVGEVTVTGAEPAIQAQETLASLPGAGPYAEALERAVRAVSRPHRIGRQTVDAVSSAVAPTGVEVSRRRCVQVDARRPGDVQLSRRTLTELRHSIDLLATITPSPSRLLQSFKEEFERRYATRSVPVLEALDPDFGIRLPSDGGAVEAATVLAGDVGRRRLLLGLIERGRSAPEAAVELTDTDIAGLTPKRPNVLPASFGMVTSLIGVSAAAVAAGSFRIVEPTLFGPPGTRLLGRLCRGDSELERLVREHLRRESTLIPDVILAELSVAPETEGGLNINQRPLLREWEIEYGGASGAPAHRRLEPADLMVSVEDDEVVLRSARLKRRVVPVLTTATNPLWISLPAARFLLSLAHQGITASLGWSWEELADAPALPRVTHGRTILALRRWNVPAAELAEVRPGTDAAGFQRLQRWRLHRGLPRLVSFDHPESRVLVDFGNVLSIDAFLASIRAFDLVPLVEALAGEASPVHGPDGHYAHELIVPFTQARHAAPRARPRRARQPVSERRRRFEPGSEWLYANLYGPEGAADRVLVDHVGPLARRLRDGGLVDRWFFIRYADPGQHVRVRYHGRPSDLLADVLPAVNEAMAPALADGLLYRISIDTYEREIERYGGLAGVELMERAAEADSDAVVAILGHRPSAVERRHLAVASIAGLYADAGLPLETKHACCVGLRTNWMPHGIPLGTLFGAQERSEREQLAQTVAALGRGDANPPIHALRARSESLVRILHQLRTLDEEEILERPLADVMCSLAHMAVNRLLKRGDSVEEARVHHALARIYEAEIAREPAHHDKIRGITAPEITAPDGRGAG
jgi:thiopeptide-type bacteriocin biosynthesis protein